MFQRGLRKPEVGNWAHRQSWVFPSGRACEAQGWGKGKFRTQGQRSEGHRRSLEARSPGLCKHGKESGS